MFMGNDIDEAFSECTVVAMLSDGSRLKAKVRGYDDVTTHIRKKLDDFKASYITHDKINEGNNIDPDYFWGD